jgi:hypothetical protein
MLPSPLFFPPACYRPVIQSDASRTHTMRALCDLAGIPCRASGSWVDRLVGWFEDDQLTIQAQPGYTGDVLVGVPHRVARHGLTEISRYLLQVMAYSELFDGVARESVRGVPWARHIAQSGRPPSAITKSNAQRQREWRLRSKSQEQISG